MQLVSIQNKILEVSKINQILVFDLVEHDEVEIIALTQVLKSNNDSFHEEFIFHIDTGNHIEQI